MRARETPEHWNRLLELIPTDGTLPEMTPELKTLGRLFRGKDEKGKGKRNSKYVYVLYADKSFTRHLSLEECAKTFGMDYPTMEEYIDNEYIINNKMMFTRVEPRLKHYQIKFKDGHTERYPRIRDICDRYDVPLSTVSKACRERKQITGGRLKGCKVYSYHAKKEPF